MWILRRKENGKLLVAAFSSRETALKFRKSTWKAYSDVLLLQGAF